MSRAITRNIDGEKLRMELNRRDLRLAIVSDELGHNPDYMAGIIKTGKMTEATARMLEKLYNIQLKDILAPQELETPEQVPGQITFGQAPMINYSVLQDIIYAAVRNALKDAKEAEHGTEN